MKVTVENPPPTPQDFPAIDLNPGQVGILTAVSDLATAKVGDPAVRGPGDSLIFPRHAGHSNVRTWDAYRVRHLLPGEKVIFEGE